MSCAPACSPSRTPRVVSRSPSGAPPAPAPIASLLGGQTCPCAYLRTSCLLPERALREAALALPGPAPGEVRWVILAGAGDQGPPGSPAAAPRRCPRATCVSASPPSVKGRSGGGGCAPAPPGLWGIWVLGAGCPLLPPGCPALLPVPADEGPGSPHCRLSPASPFPLCAVSMGARCAGTGAWLGAWGGGQSSQAGVPSEPTSAPHGGAGGAGAAGAAASGCHQPSLTSPILGQRVPVMIKNGNGKPRALTTPRLHA